MTKYYGIRNYYPRLKRKLGQKTVAYLRLCRPFTGLAALSAGLFGTLAPVSSQLSFEHVKMSIYIGVTLMLSQFVGQIMNQYADAELDRTLPEKRDRPIPSGLVSREEALGLAWLLALFSVGRAFTISVFLGLTVLTLLFFAVFYSIAPFSPRKIHPILNTCWMAVSRGFLPMFAVLSVYGNIEQAWPYATLAFIWVFAFQPFKDTSDSEADKKFGIKTLFTSFGERGAIRIIRVSSAIVVAYIMMLAYYDRTYLVFLLLVPLIIIADITGLKSMKLLENNRGWVCFYLGLSFIYILLFIVNHI